ncbi:hypothetical protein SCOR_02875 [Sulfidibacter corallicola]|uniref:Uncharacterized protein n=1 Tax=Sulfidibacter corallicola TaxID=2818388 RepID=A0A8A4TIC1_SULCO|nr:hypothetical protein [Sulfidibacter corallicola]QTD48528.1 hypothetical protein J3U87_23355 [Sulfidibacter corallicola]
MKPTRRLFCLIKWSLLIGTPCTIALMVAAWLWLRPNGLAYSGPLDDYIQERRGSLSSVTSFAATETWRSSEIEYLELTSSSGMHFRMAVRRPLGPQPEKLPVVILIGGFDRGHRAIKLLEEDLHMVVVALSYPYRGKTRMSGVEYLIALRELRAGLHDTPAAILLALDYLLTLPNVDGGQVELVGISLGSFFTIVAGAADPRFTRIWSLQGGADIPGLLEHTMKPKIRFRPLRACLVKLGQVLLTRLEPYQHVQHISPRPFVQINARHDVRIPQWSAEKLHASAGDPKELIWTETGHIDAARASIIADLSELVLLRIERGKSAP